MLVISCSVDDNLDAAIQENIDESNLETQYLYYAAPYSLYDLDGAEMREYFSSLTIEQKATLRKNYLREKHLIENGTNLDELKVEMTQSPLESINLEKYLNSSHLEELTKKLQDLERENVFSRGCVWVCSYICWSFLWPTGSCVEYNCRQTCTEPVLRFYEGNNATQTECTINTSTSGIYNLTIQSCDNDEIRSVYLSNIDRRLGIALFDSSDGWLHQDWVTIDVLEPFSGTVVIPGLDHTVQGNDGDVDIRTINFPPYIVVKFHKGFDGDGILDGKVSRIQIW